jgi:NADH-quinone oxidoreductase subunit C
MAEVEQFLEAKSAKINNVTHKKLRLYFNVDNENIVEIADYLFNTLGCRLSTATAMEMYHGLEIVYHFSHDDTGYYFCPRVTIKDKANPKVNSISSVLEGAIWIEREMFDFWGIEFIGHPRMERLLALHHPRKLDKPLRFGEVQ